MTATIASFCALVVLFTTVVTQAADNEPPPSAYRKVMEAQYAAKGVPPPIRPQEAQRMHDSYLNSIGKPGKDLSTDSTILAPSR